MDFATVLGSAPLRPNPWWVSQESRDTLLQVADHVWADATGFQVNGIYVYSLPHLRATLKKLRSLKSIKNVFFAFKANFSPVLIREADAAGLNFECVSGQELRHLLSIFPAIDGSRILFTPNFASRREYEAVIEMFHSEERQALVSSGQIKQTTPYLVIDNTSMLEKWGPSIFLNRSVFLRVDPAEDGHGHHSHVYTGSASKFGIMPDEIRSDVFQSLLKQHNITVTGLHMHKGSGISNASEWARSAQSLLALLPVFPGLEIVDIGGGLGVPYKPSSPEFDLSSLDAGLQEIVLQYPNISFVAEPGRFVAAECGVLLAKVTQTKEKNSRRFVGMSCGMNALIRPALYESYHHVVNISRFHENYLREALPNALEIASQTSPSFNEAHPVENALVADIVGPICETGDFIGKDRVVPSATQEDDVMLIDTVGAYGRVMACNYNMRPIGPDVYVEEDGSFVVSQPHLHF